MSDVKTMLEGIETVLKTSETTVLGMAMGSRVQIKKLAEDVAKVVGQEPKKVLEFVNHFAHNTDLGHVSRGKNGGFIRGPKAVKPVKVAKPKKVVADTASANDTAVDTTVTA